MPNVTHIMRNGRQLIGAREKIFAGHEGPLREEIAASWQRSMAYGLRPDRFSVPYTDAALQAGPLYLVAVPVADAVGGDLEGTGVSLVVSDHEARILDRRAPDMSVRARLDRICLAPGFRYDEEAVGTTAISVALSRQGPAMVAEGEHYADTAHDRLPPAPDLPQAGRDLAGRTDPGGSSAHRAPLRAIGPVRRVRGGHAARAAHPRRCRPRPRHPAPSRAPSQGTGYAPGSPRTPV